MILDRNICTQCGEKNFNDDNYMQDERVCKECFSKVSSELDSVYWYRYLLVHINNPTKYLDDIKDYYAPFCMVIILFISYSFQYNYNWILLKVLGVAFLLMALITFFLNIATRLFSPEPKTLKQKQFDITVNKEIYQKFEFFEIYKDYFIKDKKGNNIFRVLKVEDIEKSKKALEKIYNNDYVFFLEKSVAIALICTILTVVLYSIISGNSIYINNTKLLDLTNKNNWVTISQKSCEDVGGVYNKKENKCKAEWFDAKEICRAHSARLATFDEYSKAHLFTLRDEDAVWTNTAERDYISLFFNALSSIFRTHPSERNAKSAFTNNISQVGKPLTKSTNEKFIVKCVKGTSDYYLRNFDTKKLP